MDDLAAIERELNEARDALLEFWEQGEGQVCFLALRTADDAIAAYRAAVASAGAARAAQAWERVRPLADEVTRLRASLEGAM